MATSPAGKKPAPRKTPAKKPAAPVKKPAGKVAPARKPAAKKVPAVKTEANAAKSKAGAPRTTRKVIKKNSNKALLQLGLTEKQQRFVDEYLVDLNATQAAARSGYSADTAGAIGHENLKKPEIQLAIAEARKQQQERTQITADRVVMELGLIAFADARELAEIKTGCCRCCWGEGFKFQRTLGEYNHDREQWLAKGKELVEFDDQGGIGFNALKLPHPECPNCGGDGDARVVLKDTRNLSPQARALYAGAKTGKYGIEVQTHSKMDAIDKLAKHLGVYEKDNQQKTDPLAALLNRIAAGNANGFIPVERDPEAPAVSAASGPPAGNTLMPRQDVDDADQG